MSKTDGEFKVVRADNVHIDEAISIEGDNYRLKYMRVPLVGLKISSPFTTEWTFTWGTPQDAQGNPVTDVVTVNPRGPEVPDQLTTLRPIDLIRLQYAITYSSASPASLQRDIFTRAGVTHYNQPKYIAESPVAGGVASSYEVYEVEAGVKLSAGLTETNSPVAPVVDNLQNDCWLYIEYY